jgi:Fe-Mn family superoxide dismutase
MTLPYSKDAFGDFCSAETFDYHHGKHLNAYVTKTNAMKEGTEFENMPLEEIIKKSEGGLFNNAAQVFNHEFFFNLLAPKGKAKPEGDLLKAIEEAFGSFEAFKKEFIDKAANLFGSGWAWLVKNADGKLEIRQYSNAQTPVTEDVTPLLTADVWEHAYYIDYRNARPSYLEKFFEHINWDFVAEKF